jgi:DNA repair protein RecO (recombination protein O)
VLDCCVSCGRGEPLVAFDAATGGALCAQCRRGRAVSAAALSLLRRIGGGELGVVLREVDPPGAGEVHSLMGAAIEEHLGRRLRTLAVSPEPSH